MLYLRLRSPGFPPPAVTQKWPSCLVFKIKVSVPPKSLGVLYFFGNNVLIMCLWLSTTCELLDPYEKALINYLCWGAMMNYNQFLLISRRISNSVIDDGTTTLFWKYLWNSGTNSDTLLCDALPRLFSYTLNKDICGGLIRLKRIYNF
jgi:hypothetical protein